MTDRTIQEQIIDLSIELERAIAELYRLFADKLPKDANFWWQLHLEEKNHGRIIKTARDSFLKKGKFPFDMLPQCIVSLQKDLDKIWDMVTRFSQHPPTRKQALIAALEAEMSAGETHYTEFMEQEAQDSIASAFQQLNRADNAHAARIRDYLKEQFPDDH
jgi:hypothetical protein